jgi:hypothetical protein
VRFTLEAIERRVDDPAGSTKVVNNGFLARGGVSPIPDGVKATAADRLEVEARGRASVVAERSGDLQRIAGFAGAVQVKAASLAPLAASVREAALQHVLEDLIEAGMVTKTGEVTEGFRRQLSYERTTSLPTPGVVVKGCLDECDTCEPNLERRIELELKLLERQIELLDRSQEYRCCPCDEKETPPA